jgi:hypothetical protein
MSIGDPGLSISIWNVSNPYGISSAIPVWTFTRSSELATPSGVALTSLVDEFVFRELWALPRDGSPEAIETVTSWQYQFGICSAQLRSPQPRSDPLAGGLPIPDAISSYQDMLLARALVSWWVAGTEGTATPEIWAGLPGAPQSVSDGNEYFDTWINDGLTGTRLHVTQGDLPLGFDLYEAACIQLTQVISDPLPLRRCQNLRCGRPFLRQRGTERAGQHRTKGVKYCSAACGKAQNQRDRNSRKSQ